MRKKLGILNTLLFSDIIYDIKNALISIDDGEEIAWIYNKICIKKVKYLGDSIWEEIKEKK